MLDWRFERQEPSRTSCLIGRKKGSVYVYVCMQMFKFLLCINLWPDPHMCVGGRVAIVRLMISGQITV